MRGRRLFFGEKSHHWGADGTLLWKEKHPLAKGFKVLWQRIRLRSCFEFIGWLFYGAPPIASEINSKQLLKLGQESALWRNNADFWGRKMLCWPTRRNSGTGKCFVDEQCRFLGQESALWRNNANFWVPESVSPSRSTPTSDRWRDSDFYTEYLSTQF